MIQIYREPIIIDISDAFGLQRKAVYKKLVDDYFQASTYIVVSIKYFKDGIEINNKAKGISEYEVSITANNSTVVDINTGVPFMEINEFINTYQEKGENQELLYNNGSPIWKVDTPTVMGESDFYCYVRDNVPSLLKNLITSAIQRASLANKL
jgi:hypothetical protein